MRAAYVATQSAEDPLAGLTVGELEVPEPPEGFRRVRVVASCLNHHDLWSLRGVGLPADRLPMVLGCDAAGTDDDGNDVIVHGVVSSPGWRGDETLDPQRTLLSERYPGTMADWVWVPERNLVPKPDELTFEEAACLPTAWLTAYRMLFTVSPAAPGATILVQGAGGGVASALIALAAAAGFRVWATSRSEEKRQRALALGADQVFEDGARLPERVDVAFDSVGEATWAHSLKSLVPGGTVVTCGATSGPAPSADLNRVFFLQLRVLGSTMGTRDELVRLTRFLVATGVRPVIDDVLPLDEAARGFRRMLDGDVFGKIVFRH
ncbi:zinc-binding dehydrogenase [Arthrobacter agilis]|uniref:zinc-binding dehydrogenase n=1 Tax=Arthrobacter agilis TaxID=37921 RepID=UPI000B34CE55|nr:zinc-binding dehydrogenase [Arthrobacter agilis]OUM44050.1 Zn-dependent oxidoreductase [Arthrobacter agilis]PPB46427.1 Zn-dependent oxidoreductase [Arthrobacter agilis]TPV23918.1 zinc-binding dehydrogenase [Arthrobacter agilis]VDR32664.1 Alcohol dehydrogenase [Arthrobacter agilis]